MGLKQHKGEHQVRYDDGMTPDQTITDGAEPNSKLTAKMSVPGQFLPHHVATAAAALPHKADSPFKAQARFERIMSSLQINGLRPGQSPLARGKFAKMIGGKSLIHKGLRDSARIV